MRLKGSAIVEVGAAVLSSLKALVVGYWKNIQS